jgi:hypothetical protein
MPLKEALTSDVQHHAISNMNTTAPMQYILIKLRMVLSNVRTLHEEISAYSSL